MIEWVTAGIVAVGIIVAARAIMTVHKVTGSGDFYCRGDFAMSRRASHRLAEQTGTKPVPSEAQLPPETGSLWGR